MVITEDIREKLLPYLPKTGPLSYRKKVHEKTGASVNLIYNVLHKEHPNEKIAQALIDFALEVKEIKKTAERENKRKLKKLESI